jgi:hypothetical protein
MRQKWVGGRRPRPRRDPVPYDVGASVRQVGLIESATGWMHGIWAVALTVVAVASTAALRAWWRANTRPGDRRR